MRLGVVLLAGCLWAGDPAVWVAPSLQRVGQKEPAGTATEALIWAGRGEYESFQIVVHAPAAGDLTHVNIAVTDLTGASGQKIPSRNLALFREHYVYVSASSPDWKGSNRPLGPGWYPDALIPLAAPFEVKAGSNQPVWVDVFVPRNSAAGHYRGAFTVTSDQGSARGAVSLQVWNFTLPVRPTLKSGFRIWQASTNAAETLLRNRVSPMTVTPEQARRWIDPFGLGLTGLDFWSGADASSCKMAEPPSAKAVRAAAAKYPPGFDLVDLVADEVDRCRNLYPRIGQWALALHKAGVKTLVTMAPVPELLDDKSGTGRSAVDIWAVLPVTYDRAAGAIRQARTKGDEIWSYNTLVQDAYSPKWEIDFAPINFRIQPGFISQNLGLTGLLYWRVDLWSSDPWNVNNTGKFSSGNYPGEGMLVYPGEAVGLGEAAPSMRLKWIRDGVEDYEYVALLKKAGCGGWALAIARRVAPDWKGWTRDPEALQAARRQLGEKLDELGNGAGRGSVMWAAARGAGFQPATPAFMPVCAYWASR